MNPASPSGDLRSPPLSIFAARGLRTAVVALVACFALWLFSGAIPDVEVVVDIRSTAGGDGEIFYAKENEGYHPDRRIPFAINPDGQWHTYRIEIPERGGLSRVRVDPGSASGAVEIRRVAVEATGNSVDLAGGQLLAAVGVANLMRTEASGNAHLRFTVNAPDPFVDFKFPDGAGVPSRSVQNLRWLMVAVGAGALWLLLAELAWPLIVRSLANVKLPRVLHRSAACGSDPAALVVPPAAIALAFLVLCSALLYIALNLHQSSIGIWEELYPSKPVDQPVDLGSPKHVRSDEWNTQTPWVLGQVAEGKATRNASIGGEEAPLLASVPVLHPSAIAQIKFYGFYLFDSATGFSWWWAYKTFGLALSFFWLFLLLTRGNVAASVLGSMWIYGSSFTQWWLSSNLPELLIAFALATIGGFYLLFASRKFMVGIGAALVAYAVLNLLMHMYPPFILPLAYLGAAILIGWMLEPGRAALVSNGIAWRAFSLVAALLCVALIGGDYLLDAKPSIEAMANTSYPGLRVSAGGDMPLRRLLYGYFEVFRTGEQRLPLPPTNASEASSFIVMAPLLLLAMPFAGFLRRKNALLTALATYCLLVALWISVPLPRALEAVMQAVGWSWSPPIRSVLGLGVGSIIAATVLFSRVNDGTVDLNSATVRRMVPALVLACLLLFGWVLHGMDPIFFSAKLVLGAAAVAAMIAAGIVLGRTGLLATGLAVAVVPALMVNPLVKGISAIKDKPILVEANRQGNAPGDRWAVVGAFVFSQGLKAQGLEVITGSQMIPNREIAAVLDPRNNHEYIWNRYAHVVFRSDPHRTDPVYELRTPDLYVIGIDICGPALKELGVTHVAYTDAVPQADLKCLIPLEAPADSGVYLFRTAAASSSP